MTETASTKETILSRLRHGPASIGDLTAGLGLTRNAILVPLLDLEKRGLVRRATRARTGRAGKPAQLYEIVPQPLEQLSPAYAAIAPHLLTALVQGAVEQGGAISAMRGIGTRMQAELAAASGGGRVGLEAALRFLREQGAEIETRRDGKDLLVLSHSCPIGRLVRADRCICEAMAAFLGAATGQAARSECDYADKLTCRFRLAAAASATSGD